jgi:class 3 adenylate cyclase
MIIAGLVVSLLISGLMYSQRNKIRREKKRSEELLLNILPFEVAEELKVTGHAIPKSHERVTVLFTDFKGFTSISEKVSAARLVDELNCCFSEFDRIVSRYNIEKIKTIGDAYMCASGLSASDTQATDMVRAAFEILAFIEKRKAEKLALGEIPFELRIGIHTGHVVSGVVGVKKYSYDIWGDTVNIAARMESSGDVGRINISESTYNLIKDQFVCEHRGKLYAKNKGEIDMYFVLRENANATKQVGAEA